LADARSNRPIGALAEPPAVADEPRSFELARVWAAAGTQHVSLRVSAEQDPAGWGMILADVARHVAQAYAELGAASAGDALERVLQGFAASVGGPPDVGPHDG
jgi:hypothetical protein